jgi:hypothetical protein
MLLSADETVSNNSPSTSSVDWSLDAQHESELCPLSVVGTRKHKQSPKTL